MRHIYTVEIPDDNGKNYLDWDAPLTDEQLRNIYEALYDLPQDQLDKMAKGDLLFRSTLYNTIKFVDKERAIPALVSDHAITKQTFLDEYDIPNTGATAYRRLKRWLASPKEASLLLSKAGFTGIKYLADNLRGGREDGKKNYVIFNEADAKITDHVRFFRTADGEAYGFTVGGRIYIDPRIATSETPIHEYAHLWATALKQGNAEEWKNVVSLMKGTSVWNEVKRLYPELKTDDEIADEVIAHYSGRRGAERLREEAKKIAEGKGGALEKADAISALERVKQAINAFWKGVCDFLHIHYTSTEEVADRVMKDLLDGVDPRKFGTDSRLRKMGSRTNKNMAEIGKHYEGKTLTDEKLADSNLQQIQQMTNYAHDVADTKQSNRKNLVTSGSYFSGGGLLEEGLKGIINPQVAVEFNEKIAGVYADNHGNHIVTADVRNVDPSELVGHIDGEVQYFHASPVCKNFSTAKRNAEEIGIDVETAQSTADFIHKIRPKVTIENEAKTLRLFFKL